MSKLCSKCKLSNEFGKCSRSIDGLKSACKICLRNQSKNYMSKKRLTDKKILNERTKKWRIEQIKKDPSFYKKIYNKNKNKILNTARKFYKNNKEKCLMKQKIWRINNLEKSKFCSKQWRINNPEKNKQITRKSCEDYRARKKMTFTVFFTFEQLVQRMSVFGLKCAYCSYGKFEQIDHVIPISRGGFHCLANLRPACKQCNLSKSNKFLNEWQIK